MNDNLLRCPKCGFQMDGYSTGFYCAMCHYRENMGGQQVVETSYSTRSEEPMHRTLENIKAEIIAENNANPNEQTAKRQKLMKEYQEALYAEACEYKDECRTRYNLTADIPIDRLSEICNAEREQRFVVLPCKVGDTIYRIVRNPDWQSDRLGAWKAGLPEKVVKNGIFQIVDIYGFGETVFLTREAAEAALQEGAADER